MTLPVGNQFPTPGFVSNVDLHAKIDVPIDALYGLMQAGPFGSVGHNTLASPVTGITTDTAVATSTVSVVAGRKYRISGYAEGTQVTTTGIVNIVLKIAGTRVQYHFLASAGAGSNVFGGSSYLYIPGSSGSVAFTENVSTSAGTLSIAAGAFVLVEDIGTT